MGAIFKGRIQNLEPGLKACFVDIGLPKNAFLHYWGHPSRPRPIATAPSSMCATPARMISARSARRSPSKDIPNPSIPLVRKSSSRSPRARLAQKGPRTTTNIALPGRFLVLMPYGGQCGISRKIEDDKERKRLKDILRKLSIPEGMA